MNRTLSGNLSLNISTKPTTKKVILSTTYGYIWDQVKMITNGFSLTTHLLSTQPTSTAPWAWAPRLETRKSSSSYRAKCQTIWFSQLILSNLAIKSTRLYCSLTTNKECTQANSSNNCITRVGCIIKLMKVPNFHRTKPTYLWAFQELAYLPPPSNPTKWCLKKLTHSSSVGRPQVAPATRTTKNAKIYMMTSKTSPWQWRSPLRKRTPLTCQSRPFCGKEAPSARCLSKI